MFAHDFACHVLMFAHDFASQDENGWRRRYGSSDEEDVVHAHVERSAVVGGEGSEGGERPEGVGGIGGSAATGRWDEKALGGSVDSNGSRPGSLGVCGGACDVLPFHAKADDPKVVSKFLVGRVGGQGRELTEAEAEAAAREGGGALALNDELLTLCKNAEETYKASTVATDKFRAEAYRRCAEAVMLVPVQVCVC